MLQGFHRYVGLTCITVCSNFGVFFLSLGWCIISSTSTLLPQRELSLSFLVILAFCLNSFLKLWNEKYIGGHIQILFQNLTMQKTTSFNYCMISLHSVSIHLRYSKKKSFYIINTYYLGWFKNCNICHFPILRMSKNWISSFGLYFSLHILML